VVERKALSRILVIDMETKPALAYVWGLFNQNIGISQLITPSAPICFAAKFVGEKKIHFYSDWGDGHDQMIKAAYDLLSEADAVVTYNGDSFDLKKFQGEFLLQHLPPPPPHNSIDLLKTVRKFGLQSNKLVFVGPMLNIGKKVKTEGFELWSSVIAGDKAAEKRMEKYCIGDVVLTEELFLFIKPYITTLPKLEDGHDCPACGGTHIQHRGYNRSRMFKTQRLQCQAEGCGHWFQGKKEKI
jgi:hypothetical protein